jgi:cyanophycinase
MNHLISGPTKKVILVLPMSSEEPDSAYILKQVEKLTPNNCAELQQTKATNQILVDSLQKAKLIFY